VDRAHDWFDRFGERVVFFGRVLPIVHTFISLPAGVAKMDLRKFSLFTFLGVIPWTVGMAYAGYALGENWQQVEKWMQPIAWFFVILIAAGIIWWVVKRLREDRTSGSAPDA
jgi:membrane protein DedA with SNARE-associated domain